MNPRTLVRHMREGVKNIFRNGWMTFASVSAVTVTLLLVGSFLAIMMNLNQFSKTIESDVEISVHIDVSANEDDIKLLQQRIERLPEVKKVTFSSKDAQLDKLIESMGEEGQAYELFEQDNPLNDVYIVKTEEPTQVMKVAKQIETFDHTEKVLYGKGTVEKLFKGFEIARNIGVAIIVGLLFTAMFLISNTIKITIIARRREIEIMKLVGATNGFIRWPFFIEGLLLGVIGSIIPIIITVWSYSYIFTTANPKLEGTFFTLLPVSPFIFQLSGLLIALGAFIGVWGSLVSIRKFLKV
ncbi:permease-like cell division protein FtsX [Bacillus suaedaesalsae]|uniref:Cell division protein FtsX n=1 Tax=Bacillus suaedaesalsae TaxID=2810349 RepID=A0ABS2DCX2_9BACI|nr:permease-like cell division protein FtsX [Bacillus suaedaesalsae]MBM6616306.1 ABC transporter permease [Bacillus suaedaesalsae]